MLTVIIPAIISTAMLFYYVHVCRTVRKRCFMNWRRLAVVTLVAWLMFSSMSAVHMQSIEHNNLSPNYKCAVSVLNGLVAAISMQLLMVMLASSRSVSHFTRLVLRIMGVEQVEMRLKSDSNG
jgi:hypothetical protein